MATAMPQQERRDLERLDVKCYGGKAALSWENDESRPERSKHEYRVSVQGAPSVARLQYDWSKKIVVQLTHAECIHTLSVLLGVLPTFKAGQHGAENDKSFEIARQETGWYAKVAQRNNALYGVPIVPADAVRVAGLLVRAIQLNMPWLDSQSVIALVRAINTPAR